MKDHQTQLQNYILQQLQSGFSADDIDGQLRTAGWPEVEIHKAFSAVQGQMMPASLQQSRPVDHTPANHAESAATPQANGQKRGRIRMGWQLFKQSVAVFMGNKYLFRYMAMTAAWVIGITIVFVIIYIVAENVMYKNAYSDQLSPIGYLLVFLDYIVIYFFINLYAAGLAANVLDIFEGKRKPYHAYMQIAWSKASAILVYSVIESIVGMLLRYLAERVRFVGWIIAWLLGTAWSLGTMFVIPIIVTSEKPSGVTSIKQSLKFFKQTWGENIVGKLSVNTPLALINIAMYLGFIVGGFMLLAVGSLPLIIAWIILWILSQIIVAVIGSFANNILNTALFYYAAYHKVPAAFSQDLLNQVYIKKTKRGFLGLGKKTPTAA